MIKINKFTNTKYGSIRQKGVENFTLPSMFDTISDSQIPLSSKEGLRLYFGTNGNETGVLDSNTARSNLILELRWKRL